MIRFKTSHLFFLIAGVALLLQWRIAPSRLALKWFSWNQDALPFHVSGIPVVFLGSSRGSARIPWSNGFCGEDRYADGKELFAKNHLLGWTFACKSFVEQRRLNSGVAEHSNLEQLEVWTKQHMDYAFQLGYNDAANCLKTQSLELGEAKLRDLLQKPTPWYFPYGRPMLFTAIYLLAISVAGINKWSPWRRHWHIGPGT